MLQPGTIFDSRYELIKLIGRGGFAEVWLVKDTLAGLEEALKIYAPGSGMDEDGLKIFAKELAVVHDLHHPNLLTPKILGQYEHQPYLVLQYCPNGSLSKSVGQCTEEQAWKILEQVAAGLAYLHKRGIVHQDIKPDNILVDANLDYVITDFGISLRAQSTLRKSMMNQAFAGSMDYMAPERFSSEPDPTPASDIWSLGVMMYELLEGKLPFVPQMGGLAQKKGADIPKIHADVSDKLKKTIYSLMSLNPKERSTAEAIVEVAKNKLVPEAKMEKGNLIKPSSLRIFKKDSNDKKRIEKTEIPQLVKNTSKPKSKKMLWIGLAILVILLAGGIVGDMMYIVKHRHVFRQDAHTKLVLRSDAPEGVNMNAELRPGATPIEWTVNAKGVNIDAKGYLHIDSTTYEAVPTTCIKVKAEFRGKEYVDSIFVRLEYVKVVMPAVEEEQENNVTEDDQEQQKQQQQQQEKLRREQKKQNKRN